MLLLNTVFLFHPQPQGSGSMTTSTKPPTCGYCVYRPNKEAGKCKINKDKRVVYDEPICSSFKIPTSTRGNASNPTPIQDIRPTDEYLEKAKLKFKEGEPLEFIVETLQLVHAGDSNLLKTLVLSTVTADPYMTLRLHVAITGKPETGKTDAAEAVLELLQKVNKYETYKVSPKVLYYQAHKGYSFKNKVIFLDDITDNDKEVLKNIANTSNKPPSFTTLLNQEPMVIAFDYAPVVVTTRVDLIENDQDQTNSRYYCIESTASKKEIVDKMAANHGNLFVFTESEDFKIAQAMMYIVMNTSVYVKNPKFDYAFITSPRGFNFYAAMITAIAKINSFKDDVINGSVIVATDDDIKQAKVLYESNEVQGKKLSSNAIEVLKYVPDTEPIMAQLDDPDTLMCTVESIHKPIKDKMGIRTVGRALELLFEKGLVNMLNGKYNRKYFYKM